MNESEKLSFLEKLLGTYKYSHNTKEAEFYCPFCFHHKKKLSVNIQTQNWHCWVCEKAGKSFIPLIKKVGTSYDLEKYLSKFKIKNIKISNDDKFFRISLPGNFCPIIHCLGSFLGKRASSYLFARGLSEEDILRHKIGVTSNGKYQDRVILPSYNKDGNLNFFTSRDINKKSRLPYLNPKIPPGYKKSIIPNEINIDWKKPVTIVEGFFDMVKAEDNVIPLFGSLINSDYSIFQSIVKNECKVILALDPDAFEKTQIIAENFMNYDIEVYTVEISPFKDIGEMSKEEFRVRKDSPALLTREAIFRNKLNIICQ